MEPTRILLVEDSPELAQVVLRELQANGYAPRHAPDGPAALQALDKETPDLMILDWMLPGMDGLEVLRRARQRIPDLPVLMLTARAEEADRVIGLEMGADDYLTKPFGMRELTARLHALLRRVERLRSRLAEDRAAPSAPLYWRGLRLDPDSYQATLDGEEIDLTRTEFQMLALLLRNPGHTYSRSYLLETVWEQSYIEGDRSVDNAVLRLRRKMGGWGEEIEAVWGVGYRLRRGERRP